MLRRTSISLCASSLNIGFHEHITTLHLASCASAFVSVPSSASPQRVPLRPDLVKQLESGARGTDRQFDLHHQTRIYKVELLSQARGRVFLQIATLDTGCHTESLTMGRRNPYLNDASRRACHETFSRRR